MYCPSCGKANPDDSKFCENCGATLNSAAKPAAPAQPAYVPPTQAPSGYTPPQNQYAPPVQTGYTPPSFNSGGMGGLNEPLTVGNYIVMMLLSSITCGIALLVWAFSSQTNINKKNYARAVLIMGLIGGAIAIISSLAFGGLIAALFGSGSYY